MPRAAHLALLALLAAALMAAPVVAEAPGPDAAPALPEPIGAQDYRPADPRQAALGRLLFHDPVLSGNRNVSCATCHAFDLGTADGLSLGVGQGGEGVGLDRTAHAITKRVPRHAPALWNLGHGSVRVLTHDGRLEVSDLYGNAFRSPAEEYLPEGLDGILAAQALLPVTARFEMAGDPGQNEVAGLVQERIDLAWPAVAARVRAVPEYGAAFVAAFEDVGAPGDVTMVHVANAIAAHVNLEFRSHDSPFDAFLAGDEGALDPAQRRGLDLFYGRAGCAGCHSGPLLTDQGFHALGLPAFGPGRTRAFDPMPRDVGRMAVSDRLEDAYRFRTPSLRNVALTPPYGHNGAYPTLRGIVEHHLDPAAARARWSRDMARLPDAPHLAATDFAIWDDAREMERQARAVDVEPVALSGAEVDDLVAFLHALTGETARVSRSGKPDAVPSGLPVD